MDKLPPLDGYRKLVHAMETIKNVATRYGAGDVRGNMVRLTEIKKLAEETLNEVNPVE